MRQGTDASDPRGRSRGIALDRDDRPVREAHAAEARVYDHYGLETVDHFVDVPALACRVRVVETGDGSGSPVVAIPGGLGYGVTWAPLLPALTDHRVFVVDRPGGGLSDGIDHRDRPLASIAARSTAAVFDHFSLETAPIVANSMGGLWAFRFALERPDRVTAIAALGCPALYPGTSAPLPMRLASLPGVGRLLYARFMRPDEVGDAHEALRFLGHPPATATALPGAFHEAMFLMETLPTARRSWTSLLRAALRLRGANPASALTREDLRRLDVSVCLLWGRDDPFGTVDTGRRGLDQLRDADLHEVGVGHLPWLDEPERCGDLVTAFLDECGAGGDG